MCDFSSFIRENNFQPIAKIEGYPVFRYSDYLKIDNCYMSNEKRLPSLECFSTLSFSVVESSLIFSESDADLENSFQKSIDIVSAVSRNLGFETLSSAEVRIAA